MGQIINSRNRETCKHPWVALFYSNSRPVSGYWPIFSAMQISAGSNSLHCDLCLWLILVQ